MNQIILTGMILSATPIGEYDRRIVILTKEQGKISAFAKGARRPNSHLVGAVNPFTFGKFTIYEGRASYTIQSVEVVNYFSELREDIVGAYYGFYFLEFANYYTRENNDEKNMLKLLYQSMRALTNEHIPDQLVRCIFELKTYYIMGEGPEIFHCVVCGDEKRPKIFSVRKGGLVCDQCKSGVIDGIYLDQSTLYSMQYIKSQEIEKLYTFNVTDKVLRQLLKILDRYRDIYVEHRFKSLEILETLSE